jgi:hypothetical protein
MPRKPIDYSKSLFYRIVCRDIMVKECYIGSTTNETKRRASHKSCCTNQKSKKHDLYVYKFIRDHGSWQNWQLIVIEQRPVNNRIEAAIRERYWVEEYKAALNKQMPSRTNKQYHDENKETYNQRSAAWRLANEAKMKTKHTCACGGCYTTANYIQHNKTKKHLEFEVLPK